MSIRLRLTVLFVLCSVLSFGTSHLSAASAPGFAQLAELSPSQRMAKDWFGISIAIGGNTVVVGQYDANIENTGAAYVYVKPKNGWTNMTQTAKLTPSDSGEGFGTSVAISGNVIVVGAANASNQRDPAAGPGAAYVFVKPASGWTDMTETAKLTASDGQPGDAFGNSVSISGNTIAVGAIFVTDKSGNGFAGKAYVFVRPHAGWTGKLTETAQLTASDSQLLNYMGASIAINGGTVLVGAYGHNNFQGVGYVFVKPSGGWSSMTQTAELSASHGKASDFLGFAGALIGKTAVLGAPGVGQGKGLAYVFVEPARGWANMTETARLRGVNSIAGDSFAQAVAVTNLQIVIGAPGATVDSQFGQGAIYLFTKPSTGWKSTFHARELTASDGVGNDNFGVSVGNGQNAVVAGSIGNQNPGAAYVFGP